MLRNLADAWSWIQRLVRRVERIESGANLENSSITRGRMRFIGGILRLDSGALLELIGQWRFFGNGAITGDVVAEGKWTQNGDWEFNGNGDIDGDVDLTGKITTENIRIEGGKIYVGETAIVIDGATGTISVGGTQIVIDGATGKITVNGGSSPATLEDGKMSFGTGGAVEADTDVGGVKMTAGDAVVNAGSVVSMRKGDSSIIVGALGVTINPAGDGDIDLLGRVGLDRSTVPAVSGTGLPINVLILDGAGHLRRTDGT